MLQQQGGRYSFWVVAFPVPVLAREAHVNRHLGMRQYWRDLETLGSGRDLNRPGSIVSRLLLELQARVGALENWRAVQSDLLDELAHGAPAGDTGPAPAHRAEHHADDGADDDPRDINDDDLDADRLIGWVHRHVAAVIARPLRDEIRWCPLWWEHPEAVFRFEALRRAWTQLAPEPGVGMSTWIRDHLDPCLRVLLSPLGPFVDCMPAMRDLAERLESATVIGGTVTQAGTRAEELTDPVCGPCRQKPVTGGWSR